MKREKGPKKGKGGHLSKKNRMSPSSKENVAKGEKKKGAPRRGGSVIKDPGEKAKGGGPRYEKGGYPSFKKKKEQEKGGEINFPLERRGK